MSFCSVLHKYATPAEIARGCVWAEGFESKDSVIQNHGYFNLAMGIDFGATFAASQNILYYLGGNEFSGDALSIVLVFEPDNAAGVGATVFMGTNNTPGTNTYVREQSNYLDCYHNGSLIIHSPIATYGPLWLVGERNVLVITSTAAGDNDAYLNGVSIYSGSTSWTAGNHNSTYLRVGSTYGTGSPYDGKMNSLKIFNQKLTAQEAVDYYNGNTYSYMEDCLCWLPMSLEQHDPDNRRTLDISGNGNHAILGSAAGVEEPVKISRKHGYTFTPTDYMVTTVVPPSTGTLSALITRESTEIGIMGSQYDRCYLGVSGQRLAGGIGTQSWATILADANYDLDVNRVYSVMVSWDGTTVDLHLDGQNVYSAAQSGTPGVFPIFIGALNSAGSDVVNWDGAIYEAHIFERKITYLQAWDHHLKMLQRMNQL